ncbi:MAG: M20 family metallopeptidase, partial [Candidatus Omnitrophica bacterium]|nr:M20 family metallopeptidase [Candidatus Omnitrophota bacterium]
MVNKARLVKLTQQLIKLESENPPGNEYKISAFVTRYLKRLGLKVKTYEFAKKRPNVVGTLKVRSSGNSLLFSPHLDTVPAGRGWKFPPFSGKIYQNRIYGRGATDCKGNLAVGMEAINSLVENRIKLNCDIIFAATADEETGNKFGLIPLLKRKILTPSAAVILDADNSDIIVAQKGLIHFKILIFGKKAHGAYPERGINAIEIAAKVISKLKKYKFSYKKHNLLKPPTINIGQIQGGDKVNMVADYCEIKVDLRFLPSMNPRRLMKTIKKIVASEANKFKIKIDAVQNPSEIDRNIYLANCLLKANKKLSNKAKIKGSEGATVMSFF